MKIGVHAGHNPDGKRACGAIGIIKESTENRRVKDELISLLKKEGHIVYDCTVENGTSVSDIVNKQVSNSNSHDLDLTVSIHFNSGASDVNGNNQTTGTEVLVYNKTGEKANIAARVCERISKLGYKNRGVKVRTNLGFLSRTKAPAILVECCFVDDKDDINKYNYKTMAKAIAEGILNKTITANTTNSSTNTGEIWYRAVSGSFADKNNANNRKAELEKKGFDGVFLDAFVKNEKTMYRVICGSFKSKATAENRVKELASKGFSGGFVSAYTK